VLPECHACHDALVHAERAVRDRAVDLLSQSEVPSMLSWSRRVARSYVPSFTRITRLAFACGAPTVPLMLRLELRCRAGGSRGGSVTLRVNGRRTARRRVGPAWTVIEDTVPSALLKPGVNDLEILWPRHGESRADRVKHFVRAVAEQPMPGVGFTREIYPVYGEVFSARAVAAPATSR
jgi:hypothetical protein